MTDNVNALFLDEEQLLISYKNKVVVRNFKLHSLIRVI